MKKSDFHYTKDGGRFLWIQPSGQAVWVNAEDVKRCIKAEHNPYMLKADVDNCIYLIQRKKALDYAGPMPG